MLTAFALDASYITANMIAIVIHISLVFILISKKEKIAAKRKCSMNAEELARVGWNPGRGGSKYDMCTSHFSR